MSAQRIVLITGANRGLGLETSRQLAASGALVLMAARDLAKGRQAAELLSSDGLDARAIELDVSDSASITRAVEQVDKEFGRLDVLINNAAVLSDIGVQPSETDEAVLRQNMDVNFIGPFMITRHFTPLLRKSDAGRVLNLGTQVGSFANLDDLESALLEDICPAYQASKIALNSMTALFAKEFRADGIAVNSVCPGWVMTDMGHADLPDYGDAVKPLTPAEAVAQMLWLVAPGDDVPTGGFFTGESRIPW